MTCSVGRSKVFPRALAAAFVLGGCTGGPPVPLVSLGRPGDRISAAAPSVFFVQADVDGEEGAQVVLDTGAPIALLNPAAFNNRVPDGVGRVALMTLGRTTLWKVPTVGQREKDNTVKIAPNGLPSGGLVGYTVFGQFAVSFDYRDANVALGPAQVPDGVDDAPVTIPFAVEGGGLGRLEDGEIVEVPASRILIPAIIEGQSHLMLLDTGSSWVALRSSIFAELAADGRGQVTDKATLAAGEATTSVIRLRSVVAGGVEIPGAVGASAGAIDALLKNLGQEVGRPIDGFLGAPFLCEFYSTVDYPGGALRLHRYATRDHIHDEYRRVGITLKAEIDPRTRLTTYSVDVVYPGSDAAAQGIRPDDVLVAVDGMPLDSPDGIAADRSLLGPVGATRVLTLARTKLTVRIDELLPLP
jgi:hypothetical protein